MAPGTKLCAIKLTVLAREEPRQEYRAPKTSRSWLAISTDVRGSGRHHPFCLFLARGFLVFVGLLLRQKRAGGGLSMCPTWADQHSCSGCVPKVIFSPAMHSTWEIPWCFNTARVRQIRSARTLSRRASQDTAESQEQTCCQTPECRKERGFLQRSSDVAQSCCLQRWH